jgi:diaminopimelate epimerase
MPFFLPPKLEGIGHIRHSFIISKPMKTLAFQKMHGLGNDFVVLDGRAQAVALTPAQVRHIAERREGVGCDQLIVIGPDTDADAFMTIYNADGSEISACGNASRCIAWRVMEEQGTRSCTLRTRAGLLRAFRAGADSITVDMGPVRLAWAEIPLAHSQDTLAVDLAVGPLRQPVAVNVGNPHAVFFVDDVAAVDLAALGPVIEHHPLFPERVNVEVVAVLGPAHLQMRVWERGAGITRACGTGACAAAVAAIRRGLVTGREMRVTLDGGDLQIAWREADGHVLMTGPVAVSFRGEINV